MYSTTLTICTRGGGWWNGWWITPSFQNPYLLSSRSAPEYLHKRHGSGIPLLRYYYSPPLSYCLLLSPPAPSGNCHISQRPSGSTFEFNVQRSTFNGQWSIIENGPSSSLNCLDPYCTTYCTIIIVTRHNLLLALKSLSLKLHLCISPLLSLTHSLPSRRLSHPVASSCRAISARRTPCSVMSILPSISAQCSPDCRISTEYHRWRTAAVRSFSDAIVFICAAWSASSSAT